jgi:glycosyltransferase involved in cell wall biosynthesis
MSRISKVGRKTRSGAKLIRREGVLSFAITGLQKLEKRRQKVSHRNKFKIKFLAGYDDIQKADWASNPYRPKARKAKPPLSINWVMSPPRSGGGHQNIFRFIKYLEDQGHTCRVYLYSTTDFPTVKELQDGMRTHYEPTRAAAEMRWLEGNMAPADAVFATGWETAYAVFNDPDAARKFYFVQDFEPYFYPVGSEYVLAENTYRMNLYGITAGGWLDRKLSRDYGMECDHYDFGTDTNMYRFENSGQRKEIFFYARPVTVRRGFELGVMALELFHRQRPDYTITLAGWDVSEYHTPFPYKNLKTLTLEELSDVYNQCAAGLVISLTNMSLLPLELLAAGVIPVMNDAPNNRQVSDNKYIKYAEASPEALAQALIDTVDRKDLPKYAKAASASVQGASWLKSCQRFEAILKRELNV